MAIQLTKNEKKTLKLLLRNARVSDSDIAARLQITSQAVGKIRRKLEKTVIRSYTVNLDFSKLGLEVFSLAVARLTPAGQDYGELQVEQTLNSNPNIIWVYRLPKATSTHVIFYGFRSILEQEQFFHSARMRSTLHRYLEVQEIYTFSCNSIVKNDASGLFCLAIDSMGSEGFSPAFEELEKFKKKVAGGISAGEKQVV